MALTDDDVRSWWLVRLRWGSVAGQVIIILAASRFPRVALPVATLLSLSAAMAATNAALHGWLLRRRRGVSAGWAGSILAFDVAQLTGLLYFSGGASNPFSVFYLVQITAAAATLGSRWTWTLTALAASAYAGLFFLPIDAPADAGAHAAHDFARHLQTMWVALTIAAALTAFFVTRLATGLARREAEIASMREAAARRERLSALTTLAAGAAHELATPLTTVAVAAGELERAVAALPDTGAHLAADVRLIRGQVARCREIIDEIGAGSGTTRGEMPARFTPADLVADVLARLRSDAVARVRADVQNEGPASVFLPRRALVRAVVNLVQNALDAAPGIPVDLRVSADSQLLVGVKDEGPGMKADLLSRAGEPFFTTKAPGQGLGLGLFLARSLSEQLGGRFTIESAPGKGTVVTLRLPLEVEADVQRS